jgi:hypothetical protein
MNKTMADATPWRDMRWGKPERRLGGRGGGVRRSGAAGQAAGPGNRLKPGFGGLALAFCIMHDIGAADL